MVKSSTTKQSYLLSVLRCPSCSSDKIAKSLKGYKCISCQEEYLIKDGLVILIPGYGKHRSTIENWDEIYEHGLKGDFTRGINQLKDALNKTLVNKETIGVLYPTIELLQRNSIHGKTVLELGCGTGAYGLLLKKLGIADKIVLVDISLPALKTAQKLFKMFGESADYVIADAQNLPFKENSFDLVLSTGLIEHFYKNDQLKVIGEHVRVAKYILIQFPKISAAYWAQRFLISVLNKGKWPFGYERPLTVNRVKSVPNMPNIIGNSYHDSLTGLLYKLSFRYPFIKQPRIKTVFNHLFATDAVLLFKK